jgi:hypothetical protein
MTRRKQLINESLNAEADALLEEAMQDDGKLEILISMLEDVAVQTASAPGIAMVSNNEPVLVSPKMSQRPFGKGVWRRKKKPALSIDRKNTTMMETHYSAFGIDDFTVDNVVPFLSGKELRMLAEGKKEKIVVHGESKDIVFRSPRKGTKK